MPKHTLRQGDDPCQDPWVRGPEAETRVTKARTCFAQKCHHGSSPIRLFLNKRTLFILNAPFLEETSLVTKLNKLSGSFGFSVYH
jgi:hypothetical protein